MSNAVVNQTFKTDTNMENKTFKALKNAWTSFMDTLLEPDETKDTDKEEGSGDTDEAVASKDDKDTKDDDAVKGADNKKEIDDKMITADTQDDELKLVKSHEVRLTTSVNLEAGGYVLGFSIQGRSHLGENVPCQDYHAFENLGDGWLLSIVSDGAGSAREAARGSKANCEMAMAMIKKLLKDKEWKKKNYLPTDKEWYIEIRNIFEIMQTVISEKATELAGDYKKQHGVDLEARDFNATILTLIVTPKGMMAAHIGDGRMGYLSTEGEWQSLITPHKGEEASATVFVPNNWNRQMCRTAFTLSDVYLPDTVVRNERPKAFVLMSDGCESFSWMCKEYDKEKNYYFDRNKPFPKFFNPLIEFLNEKKDEPRRIEDFIEVIDIGTEGGRREGDDRTMLFGVLE